MEIKLKYIPAPPISESFTKQFNEIVGKRLDGTPYLRYVWGMDRLERRGGEDKIRYVDLEGVYVGKPFWVLEGHQTADIYDEAEWNALCGADTFPREGTWDFIEYHQTDDEQYLPLDESALNRIKTWAMWKNRGHKKSVEALLERQRKTDVLEDLARRAAMDKVLDEWADALPKAMEKDAKAAVMSLPNFKETSSGILIPN